ncbi:MAG: ABC transporter ATP-binding protein [Phycisphaerae bacterium]
MLRAKGIYKAFGTGRAVVRVLRGASVEAQRGEFLVITGASGSGKSTFLHILGALEAPDRGTVEFDGKNLFALSAGQRNHHRNRNIGFVFQFYHLLPELSVLENVMLPRLVTHPMWRWGSCRRQARRDALEILERVGLSDRAKHRPRELSGGEMQRAAIGRALINRPLLLLADEPTGNLDAAVSGEILRLLADLNSAGQTVVMVTHDAKVAAHAHRRVVLAGGVIHEVEDQRGGRRDTGVQPRREVAS